MKKKIIGSIFLFTLSISNTSVGLTSLYAKTINKYALQDLEILENQKSFDEFFQHAMDIRPTKRQKRWNNMVSNMATEYLDHINRIKDFNDDYHKSIEALASWPILTLDDFFQIKRNKFHINWLKQCLLKKGKTCESRIQLYWRKSNKDPETGYQIAKVLKNFSPRTKVWSYISSILNHSASDFYCDKPIVTQAFAQNIGRIIPFEKISKKQTTQRLDILVNNKCWLKMAPQLVHYLNNDYLPMKQDIFFTLNSKNYLNEKLINRFLTLELLNGPKRGPIFNLAWNRLLRIGQSNTKRQSLLSYLKSLDPLPGKVFIHTDSILKQSITKLFSENFPEYLDYYGKSCVEYMEGTKNFPYGNPTMECKEFFQINKDKKWISQGINLRYSAIKKAFPKKEKTLN